MSGSGRTGIEVAVIGMAGRFPGAKNLEEFWRNLCDGVEAIKFFSDDELLSKGVNADSLQDPNYVKAEGVLDDIELFDASFFGFTPREASIMDPQHRLFLEHAWEALEDAGYAVGESATRVGVYAGESINSYLLSNLFTNRELMKSVGGFQTVINNDRDYLSTQVAYRLNLTGPALSVQTACSTSLVAVHLACQSLLNLECDMALAGGVSVGVPQGHGAVYQEGGIISPDGHCRAFDAAAQGTVKGSGVGVVVLKRLEDALNDGDTIHAVIKGTAINNDGSLKVGFTAPSVEGQAGVIEEALAVAGVEPETITYIETHGTGTSLGDPIEVAALTEAFRTGTDAKNFCAIGSVKTNIGHNDAAAGVAGLIKTVLALKHKQLPPSLNFERPNPNIDFAASPFFVNTKLSEWQTTSAPRRAGVSSFGIGGTNAHVILEEAPVQESHSAAQRPRHLLTLSARTSTSLRAARANLAEHLKRHALINLADVAFTLQTGRRNFEHRLAFVCHDVPDAIEALEAANAKRLHLDAQGALKRPVVFMFTGQGSQYVQMGRELYETEAAFREEVDRCAEILTSHLQLDLREVLYPSPERADEATEQLKQTHLTQPAIFVIEYALAKLWMSWGVRPTAMIGHSIGEYVAACLAGVFTLEDALKVVAERGRLMQQAPHGAMLAVSLSEKEVRPLLSDELSLAAVNAPSLCVVSGTLEAVAELERKLGAGDVICRRLHTSHALHSAMMEPVVEPFAAKLKEVQTSLPLIPIISTLTGSWMTETEARDANYWTRQLRQTVNFAGGIAEILKEPESVLLEIGPGQTLSALVKQQGDETGARLALSSLRHPRDAQSDVSYILNTLAQLWVAGVEIDWSKFHARESSRKRIPLPTYPFERERYWIDAPDSQGSKTAQTNGPSRSEEIADYFYVPSWQRSIVPVPGHAEDVTADKSCWVVFSDPCGLGGHIVRKLESEGRFVINVMASEQFDKLGERLFALNPHHRGNYESLMKEIRALDKVPAKILHLWSVTPDVSTPSDFDWYTETQDRGFYSLIYLAQVLGEYGLTGEVRLTVVVNNMQEVMGDESLLPEKATVLGPCKVIPQEYPFIKCRVVDILLPQPGTSAEEQLVQNLLAEFDAAPQETVVAYRGKHRWRQSFEPLRLPDTQNGSPLPPRLRERGVYLLTGGMSEIDLALANYLAEAVRARLIMLADVSLPERDAWQDWLSTHDEQDASSRMMRAVLSLEDAGAEVLLLRADLASREDVLKMVRRARERFEEINGVIHSASVAGGGMIQLKTKEMAESVLAPKVSGTLTLRAALAGEPLDFFVLFSTSLALTGVFGQVDYCAANAFLDAFAHASTAQRGIFTASIDWHVPQWETWQEALMASVPEFQAQFAAARETYGIKLAEGVEAFRRVLGASQPQVIVSTQDFQALIEEQQAAQGTSLLDQLGTTPAARLIHERSETDADYVAPGDEVEQALAAIWEELFGLQRVGLRDNFFELGGNSLLAIQLVSRVRKDFQLELPLNSLFEAPTVEGLATAIALSRVREQENEEIERLLREIESLGPDELQSTLAQELNDE